MTVMSLVSTMSSSNVSEELERTYVVSLGDETTTMTLPYTVEADQVLSWNFKEVVLQEPPDIKEPIKCKAVLQHHWWEGKVKPVRVGPSTEHWDLRILWKKDKPLMHFILYNDLLAVDESPAVFDWCSDKSWMEKGKKVEYIPPGKPGNPTKNTPAYIEIVDSGEITIYESSDVFVKMDFNFKKLKGHFVAIRRDPRQNLWVIRREKAGPEIKKGS